MNLRIINNLLGFLSKISGFISLRSVNWNSSLLFSICGLLYACDFIHLLFYIWSSLLARDLVSKLADSSIILKLYLLYRFTIKLYKHLKSYKKNIFFINKKLIMNDKSLYTFFLNHLLPLATFYISSFFLSAYDDCWLAFSQLIISSAKHSAIVLCCLIECYLAPLAIK